MSELVSQPVYSRRSVMTGIVAAASAAVPGVTHAAAPADNYDEIIMLIDQYNETEERRAAVNLAIDRALARDDQPDAPMVRASEVIEREMDYPPRSRIIVLDDAESVDVFFSQRRNDAERMNEIAGSSLGLVERIELDRARAHDLLASRIDAHSAWLASSGLGALEDEDDALYNLKVEVCERICQIQCRSLRDVNAKATFAIGVLQPDNQLEEAGPEILKSMVISLPSVPPHHADGMPRAW